MTAQPGAETNLAAAFDRGHSPEQAMLSVAEQAGFASIEHLQRATEAKPVALRAVDRDLPQVPSFISKQDSPDTSRAAYSS
jgi:hypothetical protein